MAAERPPFYTKCELHGMLQMYCNFMESHEMQSISWKSMNFIGFHRLECFMTIMKQHNPMFKFLAHYIEKALRLRHEVLVVGVVWLVAASKSATTTTTTTCHLNIGKTQENINVLTHNISRTFSKQLSHFLNSSGNFPWAVLPHILT